MCLTGHSVTANAWAIKTSTARVWNASSLKSRGTQRSAGEETFPRRILYTLMTDSTGAIEICTTNYTRLFRLTAKYKTVQKCALQCLNGLLTVWSHQNEIKHSKDLALVVDLFFLCVCKGDCTQSCDRVLPTITLRALYSIENAFFFKPWSLTRK